VAPVPLVTCQWLEEIVRRTGRLSWTFLTSVASMALNAFLSSFFQAMRMLSPMVVCRFHRQLTLLLTGMDWDLCLSNYDDGLYNDKRTQLGSLFQQLK
jgi:hypothetical protein